MAVSSLFVWVTGLPCPGGGRRLTNKMAGPNAYLQVSKIFRLARVNGQAFTRTRSAVGYAAIAFPAHWMDFLVTLTRGFKASGTPKFPPPTYLTGTDLVLRRRML